MPDNKPTQPNENVQNTTNPPVLDSQPRTLTPTPKMEQEPTEALSLTTRDGKSVSLTDEKLEQFFAALEKSNRQPTPDPLDQINAPDLANQNVSHFGLKSPKDVGSYLRSEEGKEVTAMIHEELAEIAAIEDYEQFMAVEEQKAQAARNGALLLALMYQKEAQAESVEDIIEDQIKHQLEAHREAIQNEADSWGLEDDVFNDQFDAYDNAIDAVDDKYKQKQNESDEVDKTISSLEQEKDELNAENTLFSKNLEELDDFLETTINEFDPEKQNEAIEQRIQSLQAKIDSQNEEIKPLVESGKDSEAQLKIKQNQGMQLQIDGLRNIQNVNLDKTNRVVKDNDGKSYLIPAKQNLDSIKQSPDAQKTLTAAHNAYQQAVGVHSHVAQNRQAKEEHHAQRMTHALRQRSTIQRDMSELTTQGGKLRASRDELLSLQQNNQSRLVANGGPAAQNTPAGVQNKPIQTLRPGPSTPPSTATPRLKQNQLTQTTMPTPGQQGRSSSRQSQYAALKDEFDAIGIGAGKSPSAEVFDNFENKLKQKFPGGIPDPLQNDIETIKNRPRNAPIQAVSMDSLLKNMERFGASAQKPGVAAPTGTRLNLEKETQINSTPRPDDAMRTSTPKPR